MRFSRIIPSGLALAILILCSAAASAAAADQTFRFERADAQSVGLAGEFNEWHAQPMAKQADGSWSLTILLAPGTYGYKFLVDGKEWVFDPANPQRKTVGGIENSAIEVGESSGDSSSPLGSTAPAPAPSVAPSVATISTTPTASFAPTAGEELVTEIKLTPANRVLAAREKNARLTTAQIAIVVPPGFDPAKSWPILMINNTENYGNRDAMHEFKDAAIAEGWIIIGADPIEAEKSPDGGWRAPCCVAALDYLATVWPGADKWPVVCGGMSGGAKNSAFVAGEVVKAHHPLIGMLMMGCNQDMASVELRKGSPPGFLYVPIFLSSGKADTIATPDQTEAVEESMRRTGFRHVRLETHDGAHVVCQPHISEALRWFVALPTSGVKTPTPSALDSFFKKP
ncbi:MAG TPA: hypothetical protein VGL24_00665 [Chthoniobacterales bacterium]